MLKFIASDLDGTLLPPTKIMPPEIFGYIKKLKERGILFAPASGRQLPNLKKLFAPALDDIAVIAENGGLAWLGGRVIFRDPTPAEGVKYALGIIAGVKGVHPVLSCDDCAYYADDDERFVKTLLASYSSACKVGDLMEVADREEVIKISVWDEELAAEHGGVILPPLIKGLRTMISGRDWLDVSAPHANKGRAFNAILDHIGAGREESAAFGDHMNDYEMLCAAGKAYVTANAFPKLIETGVGEIIPSNRDNGVIKKLGEFLV